MARTVKTHTVILGLTATAIIAIACGKKSSSSGTTDTVIDVDTLSAVAANKLAASYPEGLGISAFPQSTPSSSKLTEFALADATATPKPPENQSISEKQKAAEDMLKGKGDSCVPEILKKSPAEAKTITCYEFDQDMVYAKSPTNQNQWIGTENGQDTKGEACMVAFGRSKIVDVVDHVDRSLAMAQAMLCQAKKDKSDIELPKASGESLDLAEYLKKGSGGKATVTTAKISRLDDSDGKPVYQTDIVITEDKGSREIHMIHVPSLDGDGKPSNDNFSGNLWMKFTSSSSGAKLDNPPPGGGGGGGGGGGNDSNMARYMSVTYLKATDATSGKKKITYELRHANMHTKVGDPFVKGVLDFNTGDCATTCGSYKGTDGSSIEANSVLNNMAYIQFDVDPDSNEGTLSYWRNPGGNYDENARGMVFKVEKDSTTGALKGCASSGSASVDMGKGLSVRKSLRELTDANKDTMALKPRGWWHPFLPSTAAGDKKAPSMTDTTLANKFINDQTGGYVSTQCFKQNSDGLWVIDTAQTKETAGYTLIETSKNVIQPPDMGKIKPPPPPKK